MLNSVTESKTNKKKIKNGYIENLINLFDQTDILLRTNKLSDSLYFQKMLEKIKN